jgi:hypothetical protein
MANIEADSVPHMLLPATLINRLVKPINTAHYANTRFVAVPGDGDTRLKFVTPYEDKTGEVKDGNVTPFEIVVSFDFFKQLTSPAGNLIGTERAGNFPAPSFQQAKQQCPFKPIEGAKDNFDIAVRQFTKILMRDLSTAETVGMKELASAHPFLQMPAKEMEILFLDPEPAIPFGGFKQTLNWKIATFNGATRMPRKPTETQIEYAFEETLRISLENINKTHFTNDEDKQRLIRCVKEQHAAKKCDTRVYESTACYTADDKKIYDQTNLYDGAVGIVTVQPSVSFFKGKLTVSLQLASPKIVILSNGVKNSGNKYDTNITDKNALAELMAIQKHVIQSENGMDDEDIALAELAEHNEAANAVGNKRVASFDVSDAKAARFN